MSTTTKRKAKPKQLQVQEQASIQGVVRRRIFYNSENGYCVLSISLPGEIEDIKATGNMPSVREGDEYRFTGNYTEHPKFGKQFKFSSAELLLPSGQAGVARYLSNVTFGVGLVKAKKIVDALGEDCLERIKQDPSVLEDANLSFLNQTQKEDIVADLAVNSIQAELAGMIIREGVGMGTVAKIMQQYGQDSVRIVKENPYILSQDLYGVGFLKADVIAQSVGIEPNSPFRVEAAVDYTVRESGQEGHVFLLPSEIVHRLVGKKGLIEASGVGVPEIAKANNKLIDEGKCIREGDCIYSVNLYVAERSVAAAVRMLAGREEKENKDKKEKENLEIESFITSVEKKFSVEYAPEQKKAIKTALENGISVMTGGPGVGKTLTINAIVDIYKTLHPKNYLYLCAPTGRAAKRMEESTGHEAKTIHRLLCYMPETGGFFYGHRQPLPGPGLLIVDESSMMDIELAASLLSAVDDLQVVMVGDVDQLPSVGPGSVLRDIIASDRVPVTRLNFNYRQAGGSVIASFANMICRGDMPALRNEGDFEYIAVEDADQAAETILSLVKTIVAEGYNPLEWQVLAPMRRGSCGVNALNDAVREIVNPEKPGTPSLGRYRLGDKVMVIKNDYGLGVFNGDLGIVCDVASSRITVDFGSAGNGGGSFGFAVDFAVESLELLTLAYVSTVHKFQGSECPIVIMPLVKQHYMMLQRNLLYTGMTRAKKRLVLVADEWSVKRAVNNNVIEHRYSLLCKRIQGEA